MDTSVLYDIDMLFVRELLRKALVAKVERGDDMPHLKSLASKVGAGSCRSCIRYHENVHPVQSSSLCMKCEGKQLQLPEPLDGREVRRQLRPSNRTVLRKS